MTNSKWLSRTSSFQPDRRPARRFTPQADGLEDRISLSGFVLSFDANAFNQGSFNGNGSVLSGNFNGGNSQ